MLSTGDSLRKSTAFVFHIADYLIILSILSKTLETCVLLPP